MKNPNDDLYRELVDVLVDCKTDTERDFQIMIFTLINGSIPQEYMTLLKEKLERWST